MKKETKRIGIALLSSSIIWAGVIIGIASSLKGTGCYDKIQNILIAGVLTHIILIWSPLAALSAKEKENSK